MKIYTKRGDKGFTDLIGGERVSKCDPRVEAYGDLDELMAQIGLLIAYPELKEFREPLRAIQNSLMACASILATSQDAGKIADKVPQIAPEQIQNLEKLIDEYEQQLPPLRAFVLPGGSSLAVAQTHVVRTVCRRAERRILALEKPPEMVSAYINRLSDYAFVLGRKLAHIMKDEQTPWAPNK